MGLTVGSGAALAGKAIYMAGEGLNERRRQKAAENQARYDAEERAGAEAAAGFKNKASFQFPSNLGQGEGDLLNWMLFTAFEIVGGFEGTKLVKFGNPSGAVALPIPPGIQAAYEQNWNQSTVGIGAQAAMQGANALESAGIPIVSGIRGLMDQMGLGAGGGGNTGIGFTDIDKSTEATAAALKLLPGAADIVQAGFGVRVLDQVMMSYGGPAFRNFNYSFALKPNNPEDSQAIDDIIRWFKLKSAPVKGGSAITRLYKLPHVFKIQFFAGYNENERLPKIAHCALTNITAQYGGDMFRTYDDPDHSPVQVNLTLALKEMVLLEQNSFEEHRDTGNYNYGDY